MYKRQGVQRQIAIDRHAVALGLERLSEAGEGQAAQFVPLVDTVRAVPAGHGGSCGFVDTMGFEPGHIRQQVPEQVHRLADLGTALVVVLELDAAHCRAHLVDPALDTAQRHGGIAQQVVGLDVTAVVALIVGVGQGAVVQFPAVGDNDAHLAGGKRLADHERHRRDVAEGAQLATLVQAALGV